jgi:hypothetical protein
LTAKVYDNMGATGTSNPLIVAVGGGGGGGGGGRWCGGGGGGGGGAVVVATSHRRSTLSATANAIAAGGTTVLTAVASDPDGTISKVEFYDGATLVNNDTVAPYSFNFSSTVVGNHALTARAYDNAGAITTSTAVNIMVNAVAGSNLPRITMTPSTTLVPPGGTVTLTGTATATAAGATVAMVSFYMDGAKLADDTVTPYTYTATIPAGAHSVYAVATDSLGNVNSTLSQTVVGQTAPAVATTNPDIWRLLNQATFGASQAKRRA